MIYHSSRGKQKKRKKNKHPTTKIFPIFSSRKTDSQLKKEALSSLNFNSLENYHAETRINIFPIELVQIFRNQS